MRGYKSRAAVFTKLKGPKHVSKSRWRESHFGDALFLLCPSVAISPHPLIEYKNFFSTPFQLQIQPPDTLAVFNAPLRDSGAGLLQRRADGGEASP